jgi:hypothetical protein
MLALARQAAEVGQPVDREVDLADEPRNLKRRTSSSNAGSSVPGSSRPEERPARIERREDRVGVDLLADSSATPTGAPRFTMTRSTGASVRISAPSARAALPIALLTPPVRPWGCPRPGTHRRSRPCSGGAARTRCRALDALVRADDPDADIVALSGSVSNHWSRKSEALIVMSWTKTGLLL